MQHASLRPGCIAARPCGVVAKAPAGAAAASPLRPLGGVTALHARRSSSLRAASHRPLHVRSSGQGGQPLTPQRAVPPPPPALQQQVQQQLGDSLWQRLTRHMARWAGAGALGLALAFSWAGAAHAARSGGRMGGAAFGGSRYSGGFGGGGSSWGASSATSAWGAGAGSRGAWGAGVFGGARTRGAYRGAASPLTGGFGSGLGGAVGSPGSSVRMNSFFLSPFGFGYGYPMMGGGGGMLSLLFWGAFAVIMLQVVQGVWRNQMGGGADDYSYGDDGRTSGYDEVVTVAKVQVGLLGSARELQKDLERIAARADTDSPKGLHYILQETVLSLLRNPDYCLYGFAKSKRERSAEDAETAFNQLSMQERGKFQAETLTNVGGILGRASLKQKKPYAEGDKELIVVTVIVAADGGFKMPQVSSQASLREALSMLGAVRADDLLAVEVLWTPEEEGDFFTTQDLAYDYPTLNTL